MPEFKHRLTGEVREWRTDNEDIFRRLNRLGWNRVEAATEEKPVQEETEESTVSATLPADFPAASLLTAAGYDNVAAVQAATDEELDEIDGIGPATIRQIRQAAG